jgi:hypothetical protein
MRLVVDDAESDLASRAVRDMIQTRAPDRQLRLSILILPSQLTSQRCRC